jgi:hypothetical protein
LTKLKNFFYVLLSECFNDFSPASVLLHCLQHFVALCCIKLGTTIPASDFKARPKAAMRTLGFKPRHHKVANQVQGGAVIPVQALNHE